MIPEDYVSALSLVCRTKPYHE